MQDDIDLLDAWGHGDTAAGSRLFHRHFAAVARIFRHKADEVLDDLVQQTFLICVERRGQLETPERFRAFLLGIARNQLLKHFEKQVGPRGRVDPLEQSLAELAPSPSTAARLREEHAALIAALRTMPLDLQLTIELHYWHELSGPALAEALQIPEGTVRSRLRSAKGRLRAALQQWQADADPERVDASIRERMSAAVDDDAP